MVAMLFLFLPSSLASSGSSAAFAAHAACLAQPCGSGTCGAASALFTCDVLQTTGCSRCLKCCHHTPPPPPPPVSPPPPSPPPPSPRPPPPSPLSPPPTLLETARSHATSLLGLKKRGSGVESAQRRPPAGTAAGAPATMSPTASSLSATWVVALSVGAILLICLCALGVCVVTRHQMEERLAAIMHEVAAHNARRNTPRAPWSETNHMVPVGQPLGPASVAAAALRPATTLTRELKSRQRSRHALPAVTVESMFEEAEADEEREGLFVSEIEPVFGSSAALFAHGHERDDGVGYLGHRPTSRSWWSRFVR